MAPRILPALLLTLLPYALASASPLPETCTDSRGLVMDIEADFQQAALVVFAPGQIRHNPRVLPQLPDAARLFFVAHVCARGTSPATAANLQRADCAAYRMLEATRQLDQAGANDLVRELVFTSEEWKLLPGPARAFDFSACAANGPVLRLPLATPPTARQTLWNACAHACGDRLWHCGHTDACLGAYDVCLKACGDLPAATR